MDILMTSFVKSLINDLNLSELKELDILVKKSLSLSLKGKIIALPLDVTASKEVLNGIKFIEKEYPETAKEFKKIHIRIWKRISCRLKMRRSY